MQDRVATPVHKDPEDAGVHLARHCKGTMSGSVPNHLQQVEDALSVVWHSTWIHELLEAARGLPYRHRPIEVWEFLVNPPPRIPVASLLSCNQRPISNSLTMGWLGANAVNASNGCLNSVVGVALTALSNCIDHNTGCPKHGEVLEQGDGLCFCNHLS